MGPRREKTCHPWYANNKDADRPAHPRSLFIAFVIRSLESIITKRASSKFSIFLATVVTEVMDPGLNLVLSETPKIGPNQTVMLGKTNKPTSSVLTGVRRQT